MKYNSKNLIHGGNLFLDALTVHESDWKRIWRTLLKDKSVSIKNAWKGVGS